MSCRARWVPHAVLWAIVMGHLTARAEPTAAERVIAREQFEEGVRLEARGDWEGALARFSDVARVVTTPNVHYHLGLCLEHTSRLVRALDAYERSLASQSPSTTPDPVMIKRAEERIAALRRRIPLVELRLPSDVPVKPPLFVSIDDETLTLIPRQIPLDPGEHRIVVRLQDRPPFETKVSLEERQTAVVDVVFGRPASPGSAKGPPSPSERPAPSSEVSQPGPPDDARHPSRTWAYVAVGTSAAAVLAAGTMYVLRGSVISELDDACGADRKACPPSKRGLADRGATYGTLGNVFVGVGSVAAASAIVLFLVDGAKARPDRARQGRSLDVAVGAETAPFALTFRGRF